VINWWLVNFLLLDLLRFWNDLLDASWLRLIRETNTDTSEEVSGVVVGVGMLVSGIQGLNFLGARFSLANELMDLNWSFDIKVKLTKPFELGSFFLYFSCSHCRCCLSSFLGSLLLFFLKPPFLCHCGEFLVQELVHIVFSIVVSLDQDQP